MGCSRSALEKSSKILSALGLLGIFETNSLWSLMGETYIGIGVDGLELEFVPRKLSYVGVRKGEIGVDGLELEFVRKL